MILVLAYGAAWAIFPEELQSNTPEFCLILLLLLSFTTEALTEQFSNWYQSKEITSFVPPIPPLIGKFLGINQRFYKLIVQILEVPFYTA